MFNNLNNFIWKFLPFTAILIHSILKFLIIFVYILIYLDLLASKGHLVNHKQFKRGRCIEHFLIHISKPHIYHPQINCPLDTEFVGGVLDHQLKVSLLTLV